MHQEKAWLFTWNPKRFAWNEKIDGYRAVISEIEQIGFSVMRWSCGNTKKIHCNDKIYLIRIGCKDKGIVARGTALSDVFTGPHWDDELAAAGREVNRIFIRFDSIIDIEQKSPLSIDILRNKFPNMYWTPQSSGIKIPDDVHSMLDDLLESYFKK